MENENKTFRIMHIPKDHSNPEMTYMCCHGMLPHDVQ